LNRIECKFIALRYLTLDGTDHRSHAEQNSMIRRYIAWRNKAHRSRSTSCHFNARTRSLTGHWIPGAHLVGVWSSSWQRPGADPGRPVVGWRPHRDDIGRSSETLNCLAGTLSRRLVPNVEPPTSSNLRSPATGRVVEQNGGMDVEATGTSLGARAAGDFASVRSAATGPTCRRWRDRSRRVTDGTVRKRARGKSRWPRPEPRPAWSHWPCCGV
jgi:hypothetical protein